VKMDHFRRAAFPDVDDLHRSFDDGEEVDAPLAAAEELGPFGTSSIVPKAAIRSTCSESASERSAPAAHMGRWGRTRWFILGSHALSSS
jgi:hypothetical protein